MSVLQILEWDIERLEKLRLLSLLVAVVLLILSIVLDVALLDWLRGIAWMVAGGTCFLQARIVKRDGGDPDMFYIRGAILALIGVVAII